MRSCAFYSSINIQWRVVCMTLSWFYCVLYRFGNNKKALLLSWEIALFHLIYTNITIMIPYLIMNLLISHIFIPSSSSVVRPHHVWAVAVICWKSLRLALCNFWITSSCAGHLVDWKHTAIRPQQSGIQHSFFIFSHIYRPTKKYKPQNQSCMRIPFCSLQLRNTVIFSQIK